MTDSGESQFTPIELDALQETMNIAFGSAAADLAEVMDIFVELSIPKVSAIRRNEVTPYILREVPDFRECNIVEQRYSGDFGGSAFLVFPYGIEKNLVAYFQEQDGEQYNASDAAELDREVLLEIGNILIGACIGKLFELLESGASYLPPHCTAGKNFEKYFASLEGDPDDVAIMLTANFSFEGKSISGEIFLINSQQSVPYLKKALGRIFRF